MVCLIQEDPSILYACFYREQQGAESELKPPRRKQVDMIAHLEKVSHPRLGGLTLTSSSDQQALRLPPIATLLCFCWQLCNSPRNIDPNPRC